MTNRNELTAQLLSNAAFAGDEEELKELLSQGGDPNALFDGHLYPLDSAALGGHVRIVQMLLRAGADPNGVSPSGDTPLMTAAGVGRTDIMQVLLDAGADIQCTNKDGYTALRFAKGNPACEKFLRERGLKTANRRLSSKQKQKAATAVRENLKQRIDGADPVSLAILLSEAITTDQPDMALRAIRRGADMKVVNTEMQSDQDVWTLVAWAAWKGYVDVLKAAVEAGAALDDMVEKEGLLAPPLAFAVEARNLEAVKVLVEAGADVNAAGYGGKCKVKGPALLFAAALGNKEIYDYLYPRTSPEHHAQAEELLRKKRRK